MLKRLLLLFFALQGLFPLFSQELTSKQQPLFFPLLQNDTLQTQAVRIPLPLEKGLRTFALVHPHLPPTFHPKVAVRFSIEGLTWTKWELLSPFHEQTEESDQWVSELVFLREQWQYVQVQWISSFDNTNSPPTDTSLWRGAFFHTTHQAIPSPQVSPTRSADCGCPLPAYVDRVGWGNPTGNGISCPDPTYFPTTHLIVHHSAGTNVSDDWPAIVRAIRNLHVNINGWCDIGYNWLIDPNGVVYEGRGGGDDIRGAHFCGANSGTTGVCLLGNFEEIEPTEAALRSLDSLLTWKSCVSELNPNGVSLHESLSRRLPVISGHKDGCSTLCPGINVYQRLESLRQNVSDQLQLCNTLTHHSGNLPSTEIQISPQPANQFLQLQNISGSGPAHLSLYNLQGQRLAQKKDYVAASQSNLTWYLPPFPPGIYVLQVRVGDHFWQKKCIWK